MKQTILLLSLFVCFGFVNAQSLYTDGDSLDINNLKAYVFLHGDVWGLTDSVDPYLDGTMPTQYPRNSKKKLTRDAEIWVTAYDQAHQLHTSAMVWRSFGADFWPGPLDSAGNTNIATIDKWARTWKVYQIQIDSFLLLGTHTINNTPQSILEWPAKGNPYAKGRNNQALLIDRTMAPFVDVDNNGSYDPLAGDYPLIKGDEMIWWIINDNGPLHTGSDGQPLKLEVQNVAYAFSHGTNIDNVIFQEFQLNNRSANDYDSVRVGMKVEFDLGHPFDNYIGFDSAYRIGYVYNFGNDGIQADSYYYDHVPIAGICMLEQPGDNLPVKQPAGVCVTFFGDTAGAFCIPTVDTQFNNYLHARSARFGYHFNNDYQGPGHASAGTNPGPPTNYLYYGDPADTSQWSECSAQNPPGSRRLILGTADFSLNAGASENVSMALIATDTTTGNSCPSIDIHSIEIVADSALQAYRSALGVARLLPNKGGVKVYPNPAKTTVNIEAHAKITVFEVCDLIGRQLNVHYVQKDKSCELDVAALPAGIYILKLKVGSGLVVTRFVKE